MYAKNPFLDAVLLLLLYSPNIQPQVSLLSNRREEEAIAKKPKRRINGEGSIYRRKSDGRWVGQFKNPAASGSSNRYVYAKTQQEALKKLTEEMARAQAGLLGEAGRTTVAEYLGWWMDNVVRGEVAHRTYHNYLSQIRNHIAPKIGKKKLKALKLGDAEGLYQSMATSGLSPATIRYVHAILRRSLGQAVNRGLVPRNVAEGASLPRAPRKEIEAFTPEEVRRFLRAAKHDRLEALYVLAITCGLRQGELLGLRWEDVDLKAGSLTVRRQVQRSRDGSGMISGPTKNKKSRTIRLGRVAIEALKAHRDRQAEEVASAKGLWRDSNLVFASTIGTLLDPSNLVDRSFKPLLKGAALPSIRFHDLRHACGTLLFSEGVPIKVVQEVLGHSSVSVTMDVYSHVLPDMQEKAAAAMDDLLSHER